MEFNEHPTFNSTTMWGAEYRLQHLPYYHASNDQYDGDVNNQLGFDTYVTPINYSSNNEFPSSRNLEVPVGKTIEFKLGMTSRIGHYFNKNTDLWVQFSTTNDFDDTDSAFPDRVTATNTNGWAVAITDSAGNTVEDYYSAGKQGHDSDITNQTTHTDVNGNTYNLYKPFSRIAFTATQSSTTIYFRSKKQGTNEIFEMDKQSA